MKWGEQYGPEYVNRLHAGVRRHLPELERFICFTDDTRWLNADIETAPLPETRTRDSNDPRWRKLALFRKGLAKLKGRTLFLDLDLVIVGSLAPFAEHPGDFVAIQDARLFRKRSARKAAKLGREAFYQSVANMSVFRFEAGHHDDLLARYISEHDKVVAVYQNQQEFLSEHLHVQKRLNFWPDGWCADFKDDCVPGPLRSLFTNPACPPDARIVVFSGRPKMSTVLSGGGRHWFPRIGPAPWLEDAWTQDG